MHSGLLTGAFDMARVATNDWRRESPEFQEPRLSANLALVEGIRPIAQRYGKTVAQLAISWVLRRREVCAAIVGARRPAQIEETVGGADWVVDQTDLWTINHLLGERVERIADAEEQARAQGRPEEPSPPEPEGDSRRRTTVEGSRSPSANE